MSVGRRHELVAFAERSGAIIVEDDYDSEFHYDGRPVAALQGLDESGGVFYVGTFSKSTFADIRLGYVVVPEGYVDVFAQAQRHSGQLAALPVQDALAEFIDEGHFAAHIRKMTRLYGERRDRLVHALNAAAGDLLSVLPPSGGMQLLAYLPRQVDDLEVTSRLKQAGVTVRSVAKEAGFTTGALVHYVDSMDQLLVEASEFSAREVRDKMLAAEALHAPRRGAMCWPWKRRGSALDDGRSLKEGRRHRSRNRPQVVERPSRDADPVEPVSDRSAFDDGQVRLA